jgi:hypothetical protein
MILGKIYNAIAKETVNIHCISNKTYTFTKGEKYMCRLHKFGLADIINSETRTNVHVSERWLLRNFNIVEYTKGEK